jgi:hypothetical protein
MRCVVFNDFFKNIDVGTTVPLIFESNNPVSNESKSTLIYDLTVRRNGLVSRESNR